MPHRLVCGSQNTEDMWSHHAPSLRRRTTSAHEHPATMSTAAEHRRYAVHATVLLFDDTQHHHTVIPQLCPPLAEPPKDTPPVSPTSHLRGQGFRDLLLVRAVKPPACSLLEVGVLLLKLRHDGILPQRGVLEVRDSWVGRRSTTTHTQTPKTRESRNV